MSTLGIASVHRERGIPVGKKENAMCYRESQAVRFFFLLVSTKLFSYIESIISKFLASKS